MKNNFLIPRFKPEYGLKEWISLINVFDSKNAISSYEDNFAKKFASSYGTMFSHGRSGLYALFKIWNLKDDEIICPAYTCVVVPNAIVLSGNIPIFVDCEKDHFNMSLTGISNAINEKTRAIIVTHLFGYPMDVNKINEIVKDAEEKFGNKIYIIQDCAHSYGSKWNGELVTKYGDASIFGSNISKLMNSIFGGMVITNSLSTYTELKKWRDTNLKKVNIRKTFYRFIYFIFVNIAFTRPIYSIVNWCERNGLIDRFVKYYAEGVINFPNDWDQMPTPLEARIGKAQLSKYDSIVNNRIERARKIIVGSKHNDFKFLSNDKGCTYSHLVAVVKDRDATLEEFRKYNIQLGIIIEYSIPKMDSFKTYKTVETPYSDYLSEHCINFPIHSGATFTDLDFLSKIEKGN